MLPLQNAIPIDEVLYFALLLLDYLYLEVYKILISGSWKKIFCLIGLCRYTWPLKLLKIPLSYSMKKPQNWESLQSLLNFISVTTLSLRMPLYLSHVIEISMLMESVRHWTFAPVSESAICTCCWKHRTYKQPRTICWIIWIKYLLITNYFYMLCYSFFLHTFSNILNSRYNCVAFIFVSQQPWILNCQWILKWLNSAVPRKIETMLRNTKKMKYFNEIQIV